MTTLRPAPDPPVRPTPRPRPRPRPVARPGAAAPPPRPASRHRPPAGVYLTDPYEVRDRRTPDDERLDHLFEARCDWVTAHGRVGHLAVDADGLRLTYGELDARANRLARYLQGRGVRAGDRVGLLIDRPADAYAALLGAFKIGAAYVPLDVELPAERLAGILDDARVGTVLSTSTAAERIPRIGLVLAGAAELVNLDRAAARIDAQDPRRLTDSGRAGTDDRVAAVVYPDGGDEDPLAGVTIDHAGLCTVVSGAAEVYGLRPSDRAYQGRRLASLRAVEEIWVAWAGGATLVPAPARVNGRDLRGPELHAVLRDRRVTALRCDPELLASLGRDQAPDLRDLRLLLVSGGVCPDELVARWSRPGRRLIGGLRPAGATTTATWAELYPGRRPAVGVPLPGYRTVVLDVDDPYRALAHGQIGEIGIAGVGLGTGPVPGDGFVVDVLGIPGNPSGWIHRTGDLGRVGPDGVIEYHGRAAGWTRPVDPPTLVISRVPPARTGSGAVPGTGVGSPPTLRPVGRGPAPAPPTRPTPVPRPAPAPARAPARPRPPAPPAEPVRTAEPAPAPAALAPTADAVPPARADAATDTERDLAVVLGEVLGVERVTVVGHFFDDLGADSMVMARFCARLRKRPDLPSASMKDVYRHPTIRGLATALAPAPAAEPTTPPPPAASPLREPFREVLAAVLGVEQVAADAHFFADLGADSLVMARFCARIRKEPGLPSVSMKDVYRHPTLAALTTAVAPAAAPPPAVPADEVSELRVDTGDATHRRVGTAGYLLCGALQFLAFLAYSGFAALLTTRTFEYVSAGTSVLAMYGRSVAAGGLVFLATCLVPVIVKWVLVGRWKPQRIRVWSLAYVRFWIVKVVIRSSPLNLFAGSPLYLLHLRALGARIGPGAVVFARPVCTDLIRVGAGAVVLQDSLLSGYRAHAGMIETGPVAIGRDALVAEATVVDIETSIGDGAQLGRSSSLHAGQAVPAGARWHGSPARPTHVDYAEVGPARCGSVRRALYSVWQLAVVLLVHLPIGLGGMSLLLVEVPQLAALMRAEALAFTTWTFYRDALIASGVLFFGLLLVALLLVTTLPRLLHLALVPDRVYPLYGFHWSVFRTVARLTNSKFLTRIFGDTSAITGYLRVLGWELGQVEQSGSNFGTEVRQENPYLSSVGSGTMVADGLSMLNGGVSSTSFRVSRVSIGAHNFLGNRIVYPAGGRTGENCLLATKVLVPVDGEVRENVGLLGSPSFEIPRSVERDGRFDELKDPRVLRGLLRAKNAHNLATVALLLLSRWMYTFGLVLIAGAALDFYDRFGMAAVALNSAVGPVYTAVYFVLLERAVTASHALRPLYCSIYTHEFWVRERYWKVPAELYLNAYNGTPFKNAIQRVLGVRMGRRVFDDGCFLTERALVGIGDDCTLNAGSVVQCHSQEDGTFKSDRTEIGAGVTIGVGAFVHYGVTVGDGAVLAPDSFLMKGEDVPARAAWAGNPAIEIHSPAPGAAQPDAGHAVPVQGVPAEAPTIHLAVGAAAGTDETTDHRDAELATAGGGRTR